MKLLCLSLAEIVTIPLTPLLVFCSERVLGQLANTLTMPVGFYKVQPFFPAIRSNRATLQLLDVINAGPAMLESFDEELFYELIEKIIVESNMKIRFRLKNGLELPEIIQRTVR